LELFIDDVMQVSMRPSAVSPSDNENIKCLSSRENKVHLFVYLDDLRQSIADVKY